jgi:hypothetical protein
MIEILRCAQLKKSFENENFGEGFKSICPRRLKWFKGFEDKWLVGNISV